MIKKITEYSFLTHFAWQLLAANLLLIGWVGVDFALKDIFIIWAVWWTISNVGLSLGYHKLFCHRTFNTWPIVEYILAFVGLFVMIGAPMSWSILHRHHHRTSDTDVDPHSPRRYPWWTLMFSLYPPHHMDIRIGIDFFRKKWHIWLHDYYYLIIYSIWLAVIFTLGWSFFYKFVFLPSVLSYWIASTTNWWFHRFGVQEHATGDDSKNSMLWVYVLLNGEGWHNNHHQDPTQAHFGQKWYQIDPMGRLAKWLTKTN